MLHEEDLESEPCSPPSYKQSPVVSLLCEHLVQASFSSYSGGRAFHLHLSISLASTAKMSGIRLKMAMQPMA